MLCFAAGWAARKKREQQSCSLFCRIVSMFFMSLTIPAKATFRGMRREVFTAFLTVKAEVRVAIIAISVLINFHATQNALIFTVAAKSTFRTVCRDVVTASDTGITKAGVTVIAVSVILVGIGSAFNALLRGRIAVIAQAVIIPLRCQDRAAFVTLFVIAAVTHTRHATLVGHILTTEAASGNAPILATEAQRVRDLIRAIRLIAFCTPTCRLPAFFAQSANECTCIKIPTTASTKYFFTHGRHRSCYFRSYIAGITKSVGHIPGIIGCIAILTVSGTFPGHTLSA